MEFLPPICVNRYNELGGGGGEETCHMHKGPRFPAEVTNFFGYIAAMGAGIAQWAQWLQRIVFRFSAEEKHFFSKSSKHRLCATSSLIFNEHWGEGHLPRLRQPWREANRFTYCQGEECVESYLHSCIRRHSVVLNQSHQLYPGTWIQKKIK